MRTPKVKLAFDIDELNDLLNGLSWARSEGAEGNTDVEDKIIKAKAFLESKTS